MEEAVRAVTRGQPFSISIGAGGVRSLAGLGVLRGLREFHPTVSRFTGASFGALVAAGIAFEVPDEQIIAAVESIRVRRLLRPAWNGRGICSHEPLRRVINLVLPDARIEDASTPLSVWCTDLVRGAATEFTTGSVRDLVLASSVFAGVFDPVEIEGRLLADGGYTAAAPSARVEPGGFALVIDVRRAPTLRTMRPRSVLNPVRWTHVLRMLNASVDTLFASQRIPDRSTDCSVVQPDLGAMMVAEFRLARRAVEIGERCASSLPR